MQIITPAQCRAARALLNWSQPKLAEHCDIHVQTISNFEKETSSPSKTTLEKINIIFIQEGIVFLEDDGVRKIQQTIKRYEGAQGFRAFMDDIYETAERVGGQICLLNANPDFWIKWLGEKWYYEHHAPRMEKLLGKMTTRITVQRGSYNFIGKSFCEYRWLPDHIWNENSFYSYGDKIGFMNFAENNVEIIVLKQQKFAETFRFLFNLVWDQYSIIPDVDDHKPRKEKK